MVDDERSEAPRVEHAARVEGFAHPAVEGGQRRRQGVEDAGLLVAVAEQGGVAAGGGRGGADGLGRGVAAQPALGAVPFDQRRTGQLRVRRVGGEGQAPQGRVAGEVGGALVAQFGPVGLRLVLRQRLAAELLGGGGDDCAGAG